MRGLTTGPKQCLLLWNGVYIALEIGWAINTSPNLEIERFITAVVYTLHTYIPK